MLAHLPPLTDKTGLLEASLSPWAPSFRSMPPSSNDDRLTRPYQSRERVDLFEGSFDYPRKVAIVPGISIATLGLESYAAKMSHCGQSRPHMAHFTIRSELFSNSTVDSGLTIAADGLAAP